MKRDEREIIVPDFETPKRGIRDPVAIGEVAAELPTSHVYYVCVTALAGYAISPWTNLSSGWGVGFAGVLVVLMSIHAMVSGHAKKSIRSRDDPAQLASVRGDP